MNQHTKCCRTYAAPCMPCFSPLYFHVWFMMTERMLFASPSSFSPTDYVIDRRQLFYLLVFLDPSHCAATAFFGWGGWTKKVFTCSIQFLSDFQQRDGGRRQDGHEGEKLDPKVATAAGTPAATAATPLPSLSEPYAPTILIGLCPPASSGRLLLGRPEGVVDVAAAANDIGRGGHRGKGQETSQKGRNRWRSWKELRLMNRRSGQGKRVGIFGKLLAKGGHHFLDGEI
jgi:hypothetical protein